MNKPDIVFDSKKYSDGYSFQIASGYISTTTVLFENEKVYAVIYAEGKVELYSLEDELIVTACAPKVNGGREVYGDVMLKVKEQRIVIGFPVYKWIDNYPHCDGEHDRWDTVISGYNNLSFGLSDSIC